MRLPMLAVAMTLACSPLQRQAPPPMPGVAASPAASCTGAAVCDDFEAYAVGEAPGGPWTVAASAGETAVVDGGKAWSGSRSVLVRHSGAGNHSVYLAIGKPALPLPGNDLHGRLMLFITRVPPRLHWDNVRATGPLPGGGQAQYNLGGESASFLSNYEPHDCYRRTQNPYPQGRWACIQWRFNGAPREEGPAGAGTHNEFRVWLDGQPVEEATVQRFGQGCVDKSTSEWIAPSFERLLIGWEQYRGGDPIEMWVDDVAVGETPIACPGKRP
jgi:hypothetical protein